MFCYVLLCFACNQAVYLGQHPPKSASVGSLWSRWCCPLRAQLARPSTGVIYPLVMTKIAIENHHFL